MNRHFFWSQNARPPVFNDINHKFTIPGAKPGEPKQPDVPFHIHRLVFAVGVFTDSAICYAYNPPGGKKGLPPIWDEFIMGTENRLGWLGKPLGPAVRLATRAPDLLRGAGKPIGAELFNRFESDEARIEFDNGAVKFTGKTPDATQFRVRLKDVPCAGPDLFVSVTARGAPLENEPPEMARLMSVGINTGENRETETPPAQFSTWVNAKDFTSGFYFNEVRSRQVNLEFVVESSEPVWISGVTAHAQPDVMFREFEHGLVVADR